MLTVNGQQTASSSFPCPNCFTPLKDLQNKSNDSVLNIEYNNDNEDIANNNNNDIPERLKNYGDLKQDYEKYCSLGSRKKNSKICHSTVNKSLIEEENDINILAKCVLPELHLLQGFVNHVFWNGIVNLVGEERALIWPKKLNLVAKNYHGCTFEGKLIS